MRLAEPESVSGGTKLWLKYVAPCYFIQERRGVLCRYEIQVPELRDWPVGMVEKYFTQSGSVRWRTLDHWLCDWRDGFTSREKAAQDLVVSSPRTVKLIATRRERVASGAEMTVGSPEIKR